MSEHPSLSPLGQRVLSAIRNTTFDRLGASTDAARDDVVPQPLRRMYADQELVALRVLAGTKRDVAARMPIRGTDWYVDIASKSEACRNLIKATPDETVDLRGIPVPIDQATHNAGAGISHLYPQIVRFHIVNTCSAHCRYCNQHQALSQPRSPVTTPAAAAEYVRHNRHLRSESPVTEALLSGGDPMVLPNSRLFEYLVSLAEAGIETVRIGTKELAFFPMRFDDAFFDALDVFHGAYPSVGVCFVLHFSHPDEFLDGANGSYVQEGHHPRWRGPVDSAIARLLARPFVSLLNQTPIIRSVNDSAPALRVLQKELARKRISNHYFFQCRLVKGFHHFSVPIELAASLFEDSQRGLTGREATARLVMSTRLGKLEIIRGNQEMVFRVCRGGHAGALIRAGHKPDAHWITDYLDRITLDETGVLRTFGEEI